MKTVDVLVIGGGPAGVTAAVYASRYSLKTVIISENIGGWVREAPMIENWPGDPGVVNGLDLSKRFQKQLEALEVEMVEQEVVELSKKGKEFIVNTSDNREFKAKVLIFATGSKKRKLDVKGEEQFLMKGISYCVTCDGPLFKDRVVGVAGGGDSAAIAALMLSEYAKEVHLLVKDEEMNAKPNLIYRLEELPTVEIHYKTSVEEVYGDKLMKGVRLNAGKLDMDGLFIEIGMIPSTVLADQLGVELDKGGLIIVKENMSTNVPGFFAAGDITTGSNKLRQIVTAAAEGAIAAHAAFDYIKAK